jgi:hypothetical protein
VRFDFYAPDDATRGAQRTVIIPNTTADSYPAPSVKLDSTGPRMVSIDPPNNANSVALNSPVTITFTEALDAATVTGGRFRIIASDDSQAAPVAITSETLNDGQFRVRLTPTALLKSNLTYTHSISDSITDASGNKMTLPVTTNFTTVDYTEPRIIGTTGGRPSRRRRHHLLPPLQQSDRCQRLCERRQRIAEARTARPAASFPVSSASWPRDEIPLPFVLHETYDRDLSLSGQLPRGGGKTLESVTPRSAVDRRRACGGLRFGVHPVSGI